MFIHMVLFEIEPNQVEDYRRDSKMWARFARKTKGFVGYCTMKRLDYKNQYTSVYEWETKKDHDHFMDKFHDWLVNKSKARVKVLGYYNLRGVDKLK